MIAIVCSELPQRAALEALCTTRGWEVAGCDGIRSLTRVVASRCPRVVVTRDKLSDGYSDDVIAFLRSRCPGKAKVLVLVPAAAAATDEARQIALGAEYVLRDPVRSGVLVEYLGRYYSRECEPSSAADNHQPIPFAGALLDVAERTLKRGGQKVPLTPREVALARCLAASPHMIISYERLYDQILGRPFRGDTSNMRVLLGKLCSHAKLVGISLRGQIEVLAKFGYRYSPSDGTAHVV